MDDHRYYYKFRSINKYLIESLVKGTLYFAAPNKLNDPFDCQVDIKKAINNAISSPKISKAGRNFLKNIYEDEEYFDNAQKRLKKLGICSFSLKLEEPLLWSHYADEHRGICLVYQLSFDMATIPGAELITKRISRAPVQYGKNPITDLMIIEASDPESSHYSENYKKDFLERLELIPSNKKNECWSYEKEIRLIIDKEGVLPVPKNNLKQIIFGLNTSESDMDLIRQLVDNSGYSVKYRQMKRTKDDFGIEAVNMD